MEKEQKLQIIHDIIQKTPGVKSQGTDIEIKDDMVKIKIKNILQSAKDKIVNEITEKIKEKLPETKVSVEAEGHSDAMSKKDGETKSAEEIRQVENDIYELLKQVIDPEIGIDIINLGLVYNIVYDGKNHVYIEMTLSTPACPLSDALVSAVENIIKKHYPDFDVQVELTFDPPWDTSMISEEGKKALGMM